MNKKTLLYVGGGAALLVIFLYLRARSAASSGATDTTGTTDTQEASDYAQLAGMLQQEQAQEQSDFSSLQSAETQWQASLVAGHFGTLFPGAEKMLVNMQKELVAAMASQKKLQGEVNALEHKKVGTKNRHPERAGRGPVRDVLHGLQSARGRGHDIRQAAGLRGHDRLSHPVTGGSPVEHVNNHHPAGTAGHAVAPRSHAAPKQRAGG